MKKFKYEVINPSDEIFVEADDLKTAIAAILILSNGQYGLKENDQMIMPVLAFGGAVPYLNEKFGNIALYEEYVDKNLELIAQCLESVSYSRERTSMNDIGKIAKGLAERVRKSVK